MRYWLPFEAKTIATSSLPHAENEHQWSINDIWFCILGNLPGDWLQTSINEIVASFSGKNNSYTLPATSWKWASMERQQFLVSHLGYSRCWFVAIIHIRCLGSHSSQHSAQHMSYPIIQMIFNRASTIDPLAYWVMKALRGYMSS